MFWRQIPRATDVLSNRTSPSTPESQTRAQSHSFPRSQTSSPPPHTQAEQPQLSYASRNGGQRGSEGNWEKAIRGVMSEERQKKKEFKHVGDVVEAAIAMEKEKDKKKLLKGFAVRLRRRSSAANLKPRLDLEDDTPDPITLARITPFSASPPASLCGGARDDSDSSTRRRKIESSPDSSSNFVNDLRCQLPTSDSTTSLPPRCSSVPPPRRPLSPSFSEDEDNESALPPYEPSHRYESTQASRPDFPARSTSMLPASLGEDSNPLPRPQLDRRTTLTSPIAYVSLPPLPPPPPISFSSRTISSRNLSCYVPDEGNSAESIPHRRTDSPSPPSRHLSRRGSSGSMRTRSDRVAYHEIFGLSGMANLGNSCYLSAVIQGLAATDLLSDFLVSGEYRREVNTENHNGSQGQIAQALSVLFNAMASGRHKVITARRFRDIISSASRFDNYDQQDAHDFLLYLLDAIHEDLNLVTHPAPILGHSPERQAELDELPEVVAADQEWAAYRDQNDSVVIDYFQGQLRNRMECLYCHETSTTYNPLQTLSLPIPEQQGDIPVQLEDCIDEFLREEIMEDDNAWNCPRCRRPRTASKQLAITRLPQILLVQLKRFTSYSSFSSKVETPVDFPMDRLELGYLLPRQSTTKKYRLNLPHEPNTNYELYALVNHLGGENTSGHYTTVVRKRETFLEIDDEIITPVPQSRLVDQCSSSAYLLFYRLSNDEQ
ncbi:hypothetical protein JCM5350_001617 [Sporobolomyces pararoseus]